MAKEFCLHIGSHKTATTSLQRFFSGHRDRLARCGVFYPNQSLSGGPDHYAHHRIAHAIAGRDDQIDLAGAQKFFDRAWEDAGQNDLILISAEAMFRHGLGEPVLSTTAHRRYVQRLAKILGDRPVQIRVVLRRQDKFAESLYGEHVMSTGYRGRIHDFIDERSEMLDYADRLSVWADAFGVQSIHVASFESATIGSDVRRFFLDWLGVRMPGKLRAPRRHNPSASPQLVEYKRRINSSGQPREVNDQLRHWLTELEASPYFQKMPRCRSDFLSPAERLALLTRYEAGNRQIANDYLGRDDLFLEGPEADIARYHPLPEMTEALYGDITRHLLRQVAVGHLAL